MNDYELAQPYVIEQLLGYKPSGIMAIYNGSKYLPEKSGVLDNWLERLDLLVNLDVSNISVMKSKHYS
ncbi:TPA: hypothetical protein ACX6SZ_002842 [Photobacterium damselae]